MRSHKTTSRHGQSFKRFSSLWVEIFIFIEMFLLFVNNWKEEKKLKGHEYLVLFRWILEWIFHFFYVIRLVTHLLIFIGILWLISFSLDDKVLWGVLFYVWIYNKLKRIFLVWIGDTRIWNFYHFWYSVLVMLSMMIIFESKSWNIIQIFTESLSFKNF